MSLKCDFFKMDVYRDLMCAAFSDFHAEVCGEWLFGLFRGVSSCLFFVCPLMLVTRVVLRCIFILDLFLFGDLE